jgi:hypothetical protein
MKRVVLTLVLSGVAAFGVGQGIPRMPVIPVDRSGTGQPPAPDPSGVYSGVVTLSLGTQGSFTQTWWIPLKAQPCSDCAPGQYAVGATDFQLTNYLYGTERGSVSGVVNPDGTALLEFRAANCTFLSLGDGGGSAYQGGGLGPAPGQTLVVAGGVLSGRISGRDCFGQLIIADISLPKQPGVQVEQCPYRGGSYNGAFANSLGQSKAGPVILQQAGCAFSGYSAGAGAAVDARQTGPTSGVFDVNFTPPCSGTASGTAQIQSNGVISGNYSGTVGTCVATQAITGSFTLTPQ